jgi:outer membrane biosynthesis protein TonB
MLGQTDRYKSFGCHFLFTSTLKPTMEVFLKMSAGIRLAILLGISLLIHLVIIYGVPWAPASVGHSAQPAYASDAPHRLSVMLATASSAKLNPAQPEVAHESVMSEIASAEPNAPADSRPFQTNAAFSMALQTRYFNVADLDQHPAIINEIPDNPTELLEYPQGGEIVLRLWINETGQVDKVDAVSSTLPPAFIASAQNAFLHAAFIPGRKQGAAVATLMDIAVSYTPMALNPTPIFNKPPQ